MDYVVVGAGSAGCVVANRLSAQPENQVLLLEAGGRDINPWLHIPIGYFKTMHSPKTDWCYVTEPDPGIANRQLQWPRGKVLGGSSALNGLLYIRGQAEDYDHWRELGNPGWAYDDVLPYFRRSEDQERGEDKYHGTGGPQKVSDLRLRREIAERFIDGAVEAGIPRNNDFNGPEQEGVGYFQQTAYKGVRWSSARSFLHPVNKRRNLQVVTRAQCLRVLFEGRRAIGVECRIGSTRRVVHVEKEVILSAGAIGSPQILFYSGIGDGNAMQRLGIPVIHHLPGVGRNLQDHLQVRLVFKTTIPTLNDETRSLWQKALIALRYVLFRTGPMTLAASQVGIFTRSDPTVARPDIQFHMQPLSADKPGDGPHQFSAFTSSVCQLRPESRGHLVFRSADPLAYPAIHPNYLSTELDCRVAVAGITMARRIANAPSLARYIKEEFVPGSQYQTGEQLLEAARLNSQTIYHPTSTCKMGKDVQAVVNARLRVHGVKGLRVVDASIMPEIVSGNTNAPALMIGEKGADMILDDMK